LEADVHSATPQLIERARSAPLFLLSFRFRDELAAMASELGWRVIAARRAAGATQRFIASGAIIAVVDLRGAAAEGLEAVAALSEAVEMNAAALLVIGARGKPEQLAQALTAGATHVLGGTFNDVNFVLALRSAERHALRLLANIDPQHVRADVWRDEHMGWEEALGRVVLSPALAAQLRVEPSSLALERFVALLPRPAQAALEDTLAQVRADGKPRAITHRLSTGDRGTVAHHVRLDSRTGQLQGLIEASLAPHDAEPPRTKDQLTGLSTIAAARQWLVSRHDQRLMLLMIGLTRFEMINGAFGRITGDAVLRSLGRRVERIIAEVCGTEYSVARLSGATFLVAGAVPVDRRTILIGELTAAIERPVIAEGHEVRVGCCIGGAETHPGESVPDLLRRVNAILVQARAQLSNSVIIHNTSAEAANDDIALATDLRAALDRNEIDVLFQPQVAISTGEIIGVEALARWQHPKLGMLGAATLFAVAEQSNYLVALSAHIQRRAVEAAAGWPAALQKLRLAVNVTAQDIARVGFAAGFLRMLDESGFARARLTVEITESGLIADLGAAADLLAELRDGGCRVAIDDFGTGYSSLAYLKALPLDYLKIDKALAQDIVGTLRDRVVVRGVIDMARSLGLAVIAEGVETEEQRVALAAQGCNYYQGFLCAEALDITALEKLMLSR
jgi:EAL domain-containing protein (putative c-di-GMP-specific phosphodiesterase class I)/GGDEF domain-containing protein/ActR/RegA family two-component response regulator